MRDVVQTGEPPAELLHLAARPYAGGAIVSESAAPLEQQASPLSLGLLNSLQNRTEQAAASAVLDRLPFGLLVVDAQCRSRFENQSARRTLDQGEILVR